MIFERTESEGEDDEESGGGEGEGVWVHPKEGDDGNNEV